MGDANVRRPVATRFEHGVDFGLLVHKSPFMADDRDPLVLSNYIFELLEVNPGVAGFLIQLHPDDVDAVVESVTAHAEKGAGTKTTLYVGQEEEEVEEVEEEEEDAGGVGAGGRKEKPHNPLMISVQKVRIRPGKGKGQSDGWFPQPLTHNTRRVCTDDPENKLPMHSLCPTREWEREWYGVTTPNIVSGQGVILFPFGATPPLIGEAEEVVAAEPLGAFNRDPNDLVLTVGGKLVVNHLLEHSNPSGTPPCVDHKIFKSVGRLRLVPHQVDPLVLGTFHLFCREMEEHFSVFLHPNGVSAWALQEEAQKLF